MYNDGVVLLSNPDVQKYLAGLRVKDDCLEKFVQFQAPGVPVPVVGYIDMIGDDGVPIDFKTSSKAWGKDKAQGELQPLFYLTALDQLGVTEHGYRFKHVVFVRTKRPYVQELHSQFRKLDSLWLLSFIQQVWRGIEAEVFPPNPTTWKCSPNFCNYWEMCRW